MEVASDSKPITICLYAVNSQVTSKNMAELKKLTTEAVTFTQRDWVRANSKADAALVEAELRNDAFFKKDCLAEPVVELKIGAQVLCLFNILRDSVHGDVVNGSCGQVVRWSSRAEAEKALDDKEAQLRRLIIEREDEGEDFQRDEAGSRNAREQLCELRP
jgi:hypothetical protein